MTRTPKHYEDTDSAKAAFLEALGEMMGIITIAAHHAKISVSTLYVWMKEDEKFRADCEDIKERSIGMVELKLIQHIQSPDPRISLKAAQYYLDHKGKNNGYGSIQERIELAKRVSEDTNEEKSIKDVVLIGLPHNPLTPKDMKEVKEDENNASQT